MDKITHQVRAEHWTRILNECMNSGMSKTAWCKANGVSDKQFFYWLIIPGLFEPPVRTLRATYSGNSEPH